MPFESDLHYEYIHFLTRHNLLDAATVSSYTIGDIRTMDSNNIPWANSQGVYYFAQRGTVVYVGSATPKVGLWNRIESHVETVEDPAWDKIIQDDSTKCGVIIFPQDGSNQLSALKEHLIQKLKPVFNQSL